MQNQLKPNPISIKSHPIEKYCLIREPDQNLELWIEHLKGYEVEMIRNGKKMIIRFDCKKHLFFPDLWAIVQGGQFQTLWQQDFVPELHQKIQKFREQKIFDLGKVSIDNLVFFQNQNDVAIFSIFPKQLKYQPPEITENLCSQVIKFQQNLLSMRPYPRNKANNFQEYIKFALKFIQEIRISVPYSDDWNIQNLVSRRVLMEQQFIKLSINEGQIPQLFNFIKQLDDETAGDYLEKYIIDQPLGKLNSQIEYLRNLSQQGQITNVLKVNLLQQGNITIQLANLSKLFKQTELIATDIYESRQNQKLSEIDQIDQQFATKLTNGQSQQKIKRKVPKGETMDRIVKSFISELINQYWILEGIAENLYFKEFSQLIQELLQTYAEVIQENMDNNDDFKYFISSIVYPLYLNDQYDILEKFLLYKFNFIKDAINRTLLENKIFSDANIVNRSFNSVKFDCKIANRHQLKEKIEVQNDNLIRMFNCLKTTVQVCFTKHKETFNPEKIEEIVDDTLNCIFKGKQQNQQQILYDDFQNQLSNYYRKHEDYELLKDCLQSQDFKFLTNLFCKPETIVLTTTYQTLISRLQNSVEQYNNFSGQIKYLTLSLNDNKLKDNFRLKILTEHFKEYVLSNKVLYLDIQFQSMKISNQFQNEILDGLKAKISTEIQMRDKFIAEMNVSLKDQYIPFSVLEPHLSKCLDMEQNKQCIEIYKKISKVLRGLEEGEIKQLAQFQLLKQDKYQQWEIKKQNIFNSLIHTDPSQWNEQQLINTLQSARRNHFQSELQKVELCKALSGFAQEKLNIGNDSFVFPEELLDQIVKQLEVNAQKQ